LLDAIETLCDAAALEPGDADVRERLLDAYLAAGDVANARECAGTVGQLRRVAAAMEASGRPDEAVATLRHAARLHPGDVDLAAQLARKCLADGDMAAAAEYLTADTAGKDAELLLILAEVRLRAGLADEGVAIVARLLIEDVSRRDAMASLGCRIAAEQPEVGFRVIELVSDGAAAGADWIGAAAVLATIRRLCADTRAGADATRRHLCGRRARPHHIHCPGAAGRRLRVLRRSNGGAIYF